MSELNDLADLVDKAVESRDSTKEAIDTLHPKGEKNIKSLDKLSVLNPTQIDAMSVIEWQDKALAVKPGDWGKQNITEGFTDKVKALHVSRDGVGRGEVSNVFKPSIIGDMLQSGAVPPMMIQQSGQRKSSFLGRLMGRGRRE